MTILVTSLKKLLVGSLHTHIMYVGIPDKHLVGLTSIFKSVFAETRYYNLTAKQLPFKVQVDDILKPGVTQRCFRIPDHFKYASSVCIYIQ